MFLPEDWIEEVRTRNDIVEIISEYIPLKPSGKGLFGLCPFHSEKTPSFHVNPEKQFYHCFGCGVGGNVFTFIMAIDKLDFVEAAKILAERVGMPLPETTDAKQFAQSKQRRDRIYQLNREAAKYYNKMLFSPEGGQALSYLKSRGLDTRTIRTFGIGYAPKGWENIKQILLDMGFEQELLIEAGIVIENRGRIYDRFRNRVIFPIIKPRGLVAGFGGRVMDESLPKYLNSSDSPVFKKSSTLFGLNLIRRAKSLENIIIAEGYMDVIALYQFGFKNAIASLGTALTSQQAKLIRRYTREVYIAYDGDAAGQQATLRGLDMLRNTGLKVKVIEFPEGMDPDEVLQKYGAGFFKKLMGNALSLIDYKLGQLRKAHNLDTAEGRVMYATEAAKILIEVSNVLERDVHIQRLESETGFSSKLLYRQISQLENRDGKGGVKKHIVGNNRYTRGRRPQLEPLPGYLKAERYLVSLMAMNASIAQRILEKLGSESFEEPINREISQIVANLLKGGKEVSVAQVLGCVQDQAKIQQMVEIFDQEIEYDNIDKLISDCSREIVCRGLEKRIQEVQEKVEQMETEGNYGTDDYNVLLNEIAALTHKVKMNRPGKEGIM